MKPKIKNVYNSCYVELFRYTSHEIGDWFFQCIFSELSILRTSKYLSKSDSSGTVGHFMYQFFTLKIFKS